MDLLDWLPSRLLGLTYALVGRFAPSFNLWWQQLRKIGQNQALLSVGWGLAALDLDEHSLLYARAAQAKAVVNRSLVVWVVVLSVFTMIRL